MSIPDQEQAVIEIVSRKVGLPASKLNLQQRLLQDLGLDGDDAAEILIELSQVHRVDFSTLQFEKHFRSEPSVFSVLRLPSVKKREFAEKVPVTIADLVLAVKTGKWAG